MKLDKIKFAKVVSWISRITNGLEFAEDDLRELDDIIDFNVPEPVQGRASVADVDKLIALMAEGTQKIEAIKTYRSMTGMGLKESKDAVEVHWHNSADARLLARIRQALGTNADGDELVAVAKNAYRNGEELASHYNPEGATLGEIINNMRPPVKFEKFED